MPLLSAKLIGSAGRSTIVRPINDVDLFAVFNDDQVWETYKGDSRKLLYRLRDTLDKKYSVKVGSRGQAIRLFYKQVPNVEIVPAFPVGGGGYYIPSGKTSFWSGGGTWQQTDPFVHESFMAKRNGKLDNRLKPLIRVIKCWNAAHSKRLTSFHLELIAQASFSSIGTSQRLNIHQFFEWAPNYINVSDPAGYSGDLANDFDWLKLQNVKAALKSAYDTSGRALEAESKSNHKAAISAWRPVLGDRFPEYG
jgi:hypothetical protein